MNINFKKNKKKVYIIGIKGSGVIAFAEIFHAQGEEVVGSDIEETFFTDETLKRLGIRYHEGFDVENIKKEMPIDLVVHSTAYNESNNRELEFAEKENLEILSYSQLIGRFMKERFGVGVCGTHGKTTTTAMLALAMRDAGADPTAIVGSKVKQLKSNVVVGKSEYFVVEADEYQNKLAMYSPLGVVLTSIDFDHPDFFKTPEQYKGVFIDFVKRIPKHGFLVAWGESADVVEIAKLANCKVIFYGQFSDERLEDSLRNECGGRNFEIVKTPRDLKLLVPGVHNILNATAVFAVIEHLKLDKEKALNSLNEYRGVVRRFEYMGQSNGAILIDDYAHHPEEIKVTLCAAKEKYPNKNIICVFHPHTFSRVQALLEDFSQSFENADKIIVLDIYGSVREQQGKVHSRDLVKKIKRFKHDVEYIPTIEECFVFLKDNIDENDVVITMGAGNVWELNSMLLDGRVIA